MEHPERTGGIDPHIKRCRALEDLIEDFQVRNPPKREVADLALPQIIGDEIMPVTEQEAKRLASPARYGLT